MNQASISHPTDRGWLGKLLGSAAHVWGDRQPCFGGGRWAVGSSSISLDSKKEPAYQRKSQFSNKKNLKRLFFFDGVVSVVHDHLAWLPSAVTLDDSTSTALDQPRPRCRSQPHTHRCLSLGLG
jgi:hypothetical protein